MQPNGHYSACEKYWHWQSMIRTIFPYIPTKICYRFFAFGTRILRIEFFLFESRKRGICSLGNTIYLIFMYIQLRERIADIWQVGEPLFQSLRVLYTREQVYVNIAIRIIWYIVAIKAAIDAEFARNLILKPFNPEPLREIVRLGTF